MKIRKAISSDYDQVWEIFKRIILSGDTYVFAPKTERSELKKLWFADDMETFVAEENEKIVGTYFIRPNQIDLGNHIANCGYMVNPNSQGKGLGRKLCEHSIHFATKCGYKAIIFNMVVSTNKNAIRLWNKLGFRTIGTIPDGFRHKQLGFVNAHIMYKKL